MKLKILSSLALAGLLTGCVSDGHSSAYDGSNEPRIGDETHTREASAPRAKTASSAVPAGMVAKGHAFPTGDPATSAVLLEKITPREAMVGQPFNYQLNVTNLTDHKLENLVVTDVLSAGFDVRASQPKGSLKGNSVSWNLGDLAAGATRTIEVQAQTTKAATLTSCASVNYEAAVCAAIPVVQPALALEMTTVPEVLACDDIPIEFKVTNTGTGTARDIVIDSKLPAGLVAKDGRSSINVRVPSLAAGADKKVLVMATADRPGEFTTAGTASMAGGVKAQPVSRTVRVVQPKLALTVDAPEKAFLDRNGRWTYTVENVGNAVSKDSVLTIEVPSGLEVKKSSVQGKRTGNRMTYALGNMAPQAKQTIEVQMSGAAAGTARVTGRASGYCADAVSQSTSTSLQGIPAILLEVVDLEDPIILGEMQVYEIRVTNQGSAPGTNIKIACTLDKGMEFVAGTGPTGVTAQGAQVTCATLSSLAAKKTVTWRVTVKSSEAGDLRFKVGMTSDQLTRSVDETESTNFYE